MSCLVISHELSGFSEYLNEQFILLIFNFFSLFLLKIFIIFIIFDILLIGFIFWKISRKKIPANVKKDIILRFAKIKNIQEGQLKILEGDKLLDLALSQSGYTGSLGEKLKKAGGRFTNLNRVWAAHKLRNKIAHEANFSLNKNEVDQALRAFAQALTDLGILKS